MAKKYDIRVGETDSNGSVKWHEESGVMAGSPQELAQLYKMCGQQVQILREYQDDESKNYGKQKLLDPNKVQMNTGYGGTGLMKVSPEEQAAMDKVLNNTNSTPIPTLTPPQSPEPQKKVEQVYRPVPPPVEIIKDSPKYFSIGGIKCKMENGKFYQKQWMKISEEEASEIRIVSDKNNKICPMTNKHFEVLKWVLTEDSENKDNTPTEKGQELLNG